MLTEDSIAGELNSITQDVLCYNFTTEAHGQQRGQVKPFAVGLAMATRAEMSCNSTPSHAGQAGQQPAAGPGHQNKQLGWLDLLN